MKDAHAGLKINDPLFSIFKDCVVQSFREIGIDNITLGEIDKLIESFRKVIVSVRPSIYERLGGEKAMHGMIDSTVPILTFNFLPSTPNSGNR